VTPKIGYVQGTCPECGRTYRAPRPAMPVLCDCYQYCPLCGNKMAAYVPDLTPSTYRTSQSEPSMKTLYVCNNHTPPYYSSLKPVEVNLT